MAGKYDHLIKLAALDSGPCGGKSTILEAAKKDLGSRDRDVYLVEEAATRWGRIGLKFKQAIAENDLPKILEYEKIMIGAHFEDEERCIKAAELEGKPAVIMTDRGIPHLRAYLPEGPQGDDIYANILMSATGLTPLQALDRYDGVIKPTTAADGSEAHYGDANNALRNESKELAISIDRNIEAAYLGHSHLIVIDNSTDFEHKIERALRALHRIVGIPESVEIERKYLVECPDLGNLPVPHRTIAIEQAYLDESRPDATTRVRRREWRGNSTYSITTKIPLDMGQTELEGKIPWEEYYRYLHRSRDPKRGIVEKNRTCFMWKGQYFELDVFKNLERPVYLMEAEIPDMTHHPKLPPFIRVIEEVTGNPAYKNHALALRTRAA